MVETACKYELDLDDVPADRQTEYKDALSKAYLRRATAYEHVEKYELALVDYRASMALVPGAKGASDGITRCSKAMRTPTKDDTVQIEQPTVSKPLNLSDGGHMAMAEFDPFNQSATTAKPANALLDLSSMLSPPSASFVQPVVSEAELQNSERVQAFRAKDLQQQAEDAEKFRLKDEIDGKVNPSPSPFIYADCS
jgi:hypothetical protein